MNHKKSNQENMYRTDDVQLLEQLRNGEEEAFTVLFRRYYAALCVYARQTVDADDAEEIVQELMVWLWENREMLVIESTLKSYLFAAVRNGCRTAMSKKAIRLKAHQQIHEEMSYLFEDPDFYVAEELTVKMEQALAAMPETYRNAFVSNRFEQKTYSQIAEEAGVSPKTVDYRIQQALKRLRVALKDFLPMIEWLII
jgi:RNA polymerase sigma-70 factor (ECF subfamily)